jgi:hypothetical protein
MADTSSNRAPAAAPIAEDDPFAELTRIMGFDPRVKVYQPQPAEPDFGLDLERELLGEFSSDQDNSPAVAVQPAPNAVAPQTVAPVEAPAEDPFDHASAPAIKAHQADDFHDTVDTFVADVEEPVAELEVDPFADFELSFDEDETISTDAFLGQSPQPPVEASAPAPAPVQADAGEDDEIEAAYAALEAWQQSREQATTQAPDQVAAAHVEQPAEMQEHLEAVDDGQPMELVSEQPEATEALDALDRQLLEELADVRMEAAPEPVDFVETPAAIAAAPVGSDDDIGHSDTHQAEAESDLLGELDLDAWSEAAPEAPAERDVFTAEDGWLDEGTVSLDEPQVLSQHQPDVPFEPAAVNPALDAREQWELVEAEPDQATPAHDPDFERELFDLLGGEMEPEQASQTSAAVEDDSWLDGIDFAEAETPNTPEAAAASTSAEDDAFWHLDLSEVDTAPAETVAPAGFAPFASVTEPQPVAQEPDAEPDFGDFELADILADDVASSEIEAAAEAERSNSAQAYVPETVRPDAFSAAAIAYPSHEALTSAAPDPAEYPVQPDMEPDAMQPFDERAFDAALADELAADPYGRDGDRDDRYAQPSVSDYGYAAQGRARVNAPSMHNEVPDIETVDFVDQRLAHSDDLDLPEVDYGREPAPRANGFDDFDSDFNSAYHALNEEPARPAGRNEPEAPRQASTQNWDEHLDFSMGGAAAGMAAGAAAGHYGSDLSRAGMYEPEEEEGYYEQPARSQARTGIVGRRGMLMGGAAAAILLIGGVAMLAMPSGTVGNGEPTLVRADTDPMKVRPENPGGATVPNQDNVVYDRVGSGQPLGAPTQERLISTDEAPVDLNAQEADEDSLAGLSALDPEGTDLEGTDVDEEAVGTSAKMEDRLTADTASPSVPEEMVAVAPRRVRTMVVRPDGTLAPREEEAAAPAPQLASAAEAVTAEPAAVAPVAAPTLPETVESAIDEAPAAPVVSAAAPQVAAVEPAPQSSAAPPAVEAAAAPSGWAVQIASQPTEAAAQSSYDNLSRRYASVLGGKGVNIVRADIAGKGTFYRVRIPASSRAEANTICTNYKGAGGSCFVSQ